MLHIHTDLDLVLKLHKYHLLFILVTFEFINMEVPVPIQLLNLSELPLGMWVQYSNRFKLKLKTTECNQAKSVLITVVCLIAMYWVYLRIISKQRRPQDNDIFNVQMIDFFFINELEEFSFFCGYGFVFHSNVMFYYYYTIYY